MGLHFISEHIHSLCCRCLYIGHAGGYGDIVQKCFGNVVIARNYDLFGDLYALCGKAVCKTYGHMVAGAYHRLGHRNVTRSYPVRKQLAACVPEIAVEYHIIGHIKTVSGHCGLISLDALTRNGVVSLSRKKIYFFALMLFDNMPGNFRKCTEVLGV